MLQTLAKIAKKNPQHSFKTLIVDDNSPDGTSQIVKNFQKKDKSVYLLTGPKKGLGTALLRGFKYSIKNLKADIIVTNDCDFSWDPNKIPDLLKKIKQGSDVVIAFRYNLKGQPQTKGWTLFRKLNHWLANILFATHIAGISQVKDHNGNFKAIRVKNVLDKIPLNHLLKEIKVKGFAIQPYLTYELLKITNKITEIHVVFKFRLKGEARLAKNIC